MLLYQNYNLRAVLLVCHVRAEVWHGGHTKLGDGSRPMGPALLSTPADASFPFLACRTDWECREVLPLWREQWLKERGTVLRPSTGWEQGQ